jgi:hypothetical protein
MSFVSVDQLSRLLLDLPKSLRLGNRSGTRLIESSRSSKKAV